MSKKDQQRIVADYCLDEYRKDFRDCGMETLPWGQIKDDDKEFLMREAEAAITTIAARYYKRKKTEESAEQYKMRRRMDVAEHLISQYINPQACVDTLLERIVKLEKYCGSTDRGRCLWPSAWKHSENYADQRTLWE